MSYREEAVVFECRGDALVGILAEPRHMAGTAGVLVMVGGPQYRAGSHRQFVDLSRTLAAAGIPCLRFDYRGMGDSEGTPRAFTNVDEDIRAALDAFAERCPGLTRFVLWGLCDGATAAAFSAQGEARISALVMLNPWVHTEKAEARVYLKYYYFRRIASAAFWRKLFAGNFKPGRAFREAWQLARRAFGSKPSSEAPGHNSERTLPDRLRDSLTSRSLPLLILLSGRDYVAREFEDLIAESRDWRPIIDKADVRRFPNADHTFSDPKDAARAAEETRDWILSRFSAAQT